MNTNNSHDSHEQIFPADPRITAYAFGELEGDELKLIEAAVDADPVLQQAVAELRGFGDTLQTVLMDETPEVPAVAEPAPKKRRGLVIPFPFHYLATAVAACFAVVVWVRHDTTPTSTLLKTEGASAPAKAQEPGAFAAFDANASSQKIAEVKFDQPLEDEAVTPSRKMTFDEFKELKASERLAASVAGMIAQGRSEYLAGKNQAAETTFAKVLAQEPQNPEALSFSDRITKENRQVASLNLVRARTQMVQEVFNSWQRPSAPAEALAAVSLSVTSSAEAYSHSGDNTYRSVEAEPLSTFSIDVDTASYSNVRRFLNGGRLPPRDAVRVEELINYFPYRYAPPKGDVPFAAKLEVASAPWAPEHRLVRIGLKGREVSMAERKPANLVFLIDVSGSMNSANKLPLVKESLRLLVERLRPDDRVAIVTYAGSSGLALPSTPASKKNEILASLDNLQSGGSTNGAMGIHLAYDIAKANFVADGGINRVILCTDGDFNVGVTDRGQLTTLIEEKAKSRVFLSVFGFGMGNYKDATLEMLSGKGNGAYGYIDSRREAEKVFVEQVEGTLVTIAKDVKIQVEFNPAKVASYRLIGYENRMLAKEDFNNDAVDAGDIGAGHTVTALYEVVPVGVDGDATVDPLKYQKTEGGGRNTEDRGRRSESEELLTVKIRYKAPEGDVSKKQEFPLVDRGASFANADGEFRFAAAVAAWGMLLRESPHKGSATFEQVIAWAEDGLGDDAGGHRAEFIQLVRKSAELK